MTLGGSSGKGKFVIGRPVLKRAEDISRWESEVHGTITSLRAHLELNPTDASARSKLDAFVAEKKKIPKIRARAQLLTVLSQAQGRELQNQVLQNWLRDERLARDPKARADFSRRVAELVASQHHGPVSTPGQKAQRARDLDWKNEAEQELKQVDPEVFKNLLRDFQLSANPDYRARFSKKVEKKVQGEPNKA